MATKKEEAKKAPEKAARPVESEKSEFLQLRKRVEDIEKFLDHHHRFKR